MTRLILLLALALPGRAAAQADWLFPDFRPFESPAADPLEPRFGGSLLRTDLLETRGPERMPFLITDSADAAHDLQAAVALGMTMPLFRLAQWPGGGVVVGARAGVFARFRIEYPSRDDLGADWFIGMPLDIRDGRWSGRLLLGHRSSHLGDEFLLDTGAERIEFGHESLDALVARDVGGRGRVYAGGSWIFRSNTVWEMRARGLGGHDRYALQAGAEGDWRLGPLARANLAVDVQAAERSDWRTSLSLTAGIGAERAGRSAELQLRVHDGVSPLGQFFLTDERYVQLEVVLTPRGGTRSR